MPGASIFRDRKFFPSRVPATGPLEQVGDPVGLGTYRAQRQQHPGDVDQRQPEDDDAKVGAAQFVEDIDQPVDGVFGFALAVRRLLAGRRRRFPLRPGVENPGQLLAAFHSFLNFQQSA